MVDFTPRLEVESNHSPISIGDDVKQVFIE